MDIDEGLAHKKPKISEVDETSEPVQKDLGDIITRYMESQKELMQVLVVVMQRLEAFENFFKKPLIKE